MSFSCAQRIQWEILVLCVSSEAYSCRLGIRLSSWERCVPGESSQVPTQHILAQVRGRALLVEDWRRNSEAANLRCLTHLLEQGEHEWERITDLHAASQTYVLHVLQSYSNQKRYSPYIELHSSTLAAGQLAPRRLACMVTHYNLVANAEKALHLDGLVLNECHERKWQIWECDNSK